MSSVINWVPKNTEFVIAASNSTMAARRRADYVCSGSGDQATIQTVIDGVASLGGGIITCEEGTYDILDTLAITSPSIHFRGRSLDTKLRPVWNNASPLAYTMTLIGTALSNLNNIRVSDLSVIGQGNWSETGTDPDGIIGVVYGGIYYQYVDGMQVDNVYGTRVGFLSDVRTCLNVSLSNLSAYQASGPIAIVGASDVVISDIYGNDIKSVVDLALTNRAVVTNIRGVATTATSGEHVKAFDAGGCSNITLSNFNFKDFDNGINLKYEAATKTTYCNVSNGIIDGSDNPIRLDNVGQVTGARMGPALIDNVTITNSSGVGINLLGYSENAIISNCNVSAASGINATGSNNTKIHNNIINATAGFGVRAGKLGSGIESYNVQICNNLITAADSAHGAGNIALFLSECYRPVVYRNKILGSGYHGISAVQCESASIVDNDVQACWGNGISAQWQNTTYTDATRRSLDFVCNGNRLKGWWNGGGAGGLSGATKAIAIDLTGITGAAYNDASICGNVIVGTTAEIGIDLNSPVDLNRFSIQRNQLLNLSTHAIYRRGVGVLGSASIVRNNIGHITENSGTATVASGSTSIVVTHGLASNTNTAAPTVKDVIVTPTNNMGSATKFWVSAISATTFTISVDVAPGATTATFAWQVQKLFGV